MRITIKTDQYNERRHGRPWIATVASWETGQRPELRWGSWIGRDGCAGMLEIEAGPGSILRWGQKDHRKADNSRNEWAIVLHTGDLRPVTDVAAREYYLEIRKEGYYHTEIARQERMLARRPEEPGDKLVRTSGNLPGLPAGEHTRAELDAARQRWIEEVRRASAERYPSAPAQETAA